MAKVLIDVTQQDLDEGVRFNGHACAINRAAERAFPGEACYTSRVGIMVRDTDWVALLPEVAREFMYRFDMGHRDLLRPFQFEVDDPRP